MFCQFRQFIENTLTSITTVISSITKAVSKFIESTLTSLTIAISSITKAFSQFIENTLIGIATVIFSITRAVSQLIKSVTPIIGVVIILVIVIKFWLTIPIFRASSELTSSPKANFPVTNTVPPLTRVQPHRSTWSKKNRRFGLREIQPHKSRWSKRNRRFGSVAKNIIAFDNN